MTPMTVSEVSAMYHLGIKLKAGAVLFQFAVPTGRADGDQRLMLSSEEIEKATREVLGLMTSSKAPGYPDVYFCLPPEKRQKFGPEQTSLFLSSCPGGDRFLHVRADGRVSPCSWASKVAGAAVTSKKSLVDWPLADCLKDQVFDRFRLFSERINFDASFTSLISFGHLFPCQVVSKLAAVGRTESEGL
jgi:MoaA/NifB/PqqE/SkfB family radical SAM enzyme